MNQTQKWLQNLLVCVLILGSTPARAQITPDNTLSLEGSRITPNSLINGANADLINGGAQRGINLFHSFSEFNIKDGQRVYFGNPTGVQNILSRVTGKSASNILGTLSLLPLANTIFPNPTMLGHDISCPYRTFQCNSKKLNIKSSKRRLLLLARGLQPLAG